MTKSRKKGAYARRDTGPPRWHSRTVAGITLEPTRVGVDGELGWYGSIGGEGWLFVQKAHKRWQGYTADHLTGSPVNLSLARTVLWVIEQQAEWKAKLRVRRKAGTRMVDPLYATKAG
jgi:hypothetical protein